MYIIATNRWLSVHCRVSPAPLCISGHVGEDCLLTATPCLCARAGLEPPFRVIRINNSGRWQAPCERYRHTRTHAGRQARTHTRTRTLHTIICVPPVFLTCLHMSGSAKYGFLDALVQTLPGMARQDVPHTLQWLKPNTTQRMQALPTHSFHMTHTPHT